MSIMKMSDRFHAYLWASWIGVELLDHVGSLLRRNVAANRHAAQADLGEVTFDDLQHPSPLRHDDAAGARQTRKDVKV